MKRLVTHTIRQLQIWGMVVSGVSVVLVIVIEFLNALGRKLYKPFPCTLEAAEALMVVIVAMGVGYVALKEGHINVTIMTRKLRPSSKRILEAFGQLLGAAVFSFLTWGAWLHALSSYARLEIRMGVYSFPIWPFKFLFALGLTLLTIQLYFNTILFTFQALQGRAEED